MTPTANFSIFGEILCIFRPGECKKTGLQKAQEKSQEDDTTLGASS